MSIYPVSIPTEIILSQSKLCNKCNNTKLVGEFYKKGKDYQSKCKACSKEYQQSNKESIKAYCKSYKQSNEELIKERNKTYKQANKGKGAANSAKYHAAKLSATPLWAELDLIKQLYIDCELITEMTGIIHHVDHIIPLQNDIVHGFHCFTNLRIITATENLSKSNLYWPDMP